MGRPGGNEQEGFNKIAKYVITPGLHSRAAAHDCIFNKDVWERISEKDRALLEQAGKLAWMDAYLSYVKLDIEGYKKMKANPDNVFLTVEPSLVEAVSRVSKEWARNSPRPTSGSSAPMKTRPPSWKT